MPPGHKIPGEITVRFVMVLWMVTDISDAPRN